MLNQLLKFMNDNEVVVQKSTYVSGSYDPVVIDKDYFLSKLDTTAKIVFYRGYYSVTFPSDFVNLYNSEGEIVDKVYKVAYTVNAI